MKKRDVYFDNLKAILIFMVVLGHFLNLNSSTLLIGAFNNIIYFFHMPLFVFVTGYFSKNIVSQRASEIENILYTYFVFQVLNYLYTKFTGLGYGTTNIFLPTYQNWYLLGVFFWRLLIPYGNFFNKKYVIIFSFLLAFGIGFIDDFNSFLGLYRIIYFFPIFILGYYCVDLKALLLRVSRYKFFLISATFFSFITVFALSISSGNYNEMIAFAYTPFFNYHNSVINVLLRIVGFFSSIFISFGLLYFIPQNKVWFTFFGENTMNVFLIHMFLVFPINFLIGNLPSYIILIISIFSSALICILASSKSIKTLMNPLTKMRELKHVFTRIR